MKTNCLATAFILAVIMLVIYAIVLWLVIREPKCIVTNRGLTTICDGIIQEGGKK
jgi:hypothetical protein